MPSVLAFAVSLRPLLNSGASQLCDHPHIRPSSIRQKDVVDFYGDKFMYLGMIQFINSVKTGPFFEHSQILDSIAGSIHWEKITGGMLKMYKVRPCEFFSFSCKFLRCSFFIEITFPFVSLSH